MNFTRVTLPDVSCRRHHRIGRWGAIDSGGERLGGTSISKAGEKREHTSEGLSTTDTEVGETGSERPTLRRIGFPPDPPRTFHPSIAGTSDSDNGGRLRDRAATSRPNISLDPSGLVAEPARCKSDIFRRRRQHQPVASLWGLVIGSRSSRQLPLGNKPHALLRVNHHKPVAQPAICHLVRRTSCVATKDHQTRRPAGIRLLAIP